MSYSSPLIKNDYEQWVHNYLTVMSEPKYVNRLRYCCSVSYDAWRRNLYPGAKVESHTMAHAGWVSFVKGVQSMYEIDTFRAACTKAKEVIASRHDWKEILDIWRVLPRLAMPQREAQREDELEWEEWNRQQEQQREEEREKEQAKKAEALQSIQTATLDRLRKSLEEAKAKESRIHNTLWIGEANEEEAIGDYDCMKKDLEQQEKFMKEMIQARKDADKAYVAAQKEVEGAKKALELVLAANEPKPTPPTVMIPSCNLPFTDNTFKPLKPCKATLNPGTYYIGDPCYPLGKSWIYKKAWEEIAYRAPAYFHSGRGCLVVGPTAWGDGAYHAYHETKGEAMPEYHVDSGTIAIISLSLIDDEVYRQKTCEQPHVRQNFESLTRGGHIHTFTDEVEVHFKHGNFEFYSGCVAFNINTEGCETCREETDDEDMDE